MGSRRKYSQEFKREAVQLSGQSGVSVTRVARDLGIKPKMLSRWRRENTVAGPKAFRGQGAAPVTRTLTVKPQTRMQVDESV